MKFTTSLCIALLACLLVSMAAICFSDGQVDQERMKALADAVAALGRPAEEPALAGTSAEMCWTPHGEFSAVGVASEVSFGPRGLAAQYTHGSVSAERQVSVVWRYNNSSEPLSTAECVMTPGVPAVANGLLKPEGPLLPGVYQVAFITDGQTLASGKITILPPADPGSRKLDEIYLEALKLVDTAVKEIDASRAQPAAQAAERALPLLGTVMLARPEDLDAIAVYELAQMIVGVGNMEALAQKNLADQVMDWGLRSFAHARLATEYAEDQQLKSKAQHYADILKKALPQVSEAAAGAVRAH